MANHPTFNDNDEEGFWDWWEQSVVSKTDYALAVEILQRARLKIESCLEARRFLMDAEQAKIVQAARQLAYFNPPAS